MEKVVFNKIKKYYEEEKNWCEKFFGEKSCLVKKVFCEIVFVETIFLGKQFCLVVK